MERFGRFRDRRYGWNHPGIVGIKFNYREKYPKGSSKGDFAEPEMVFEGKVFVTFTSEALAILFCADFDGYMGGDWIQLAKGAYTRTTMADRELCKPPSHVRARRGLAHGQPRFDEDAWECCPPTARLAEDFDPQGDRVDKELERAGAWYYDEWKKARW